MDSIQSLTDNAHFIGGEPGIDFLLRLVVNIVSTFILIRFIYYPNNGRVKFLFTLFLMGMMIFLIASILDKVSLDMGFAFGLFAIFGIIRYRSPSIDLKEMTYLFLVIGTSIIDALVEFNVAAWLGLSMVNFIILISAFLMEMYKPKNYVLKKMMVYSPTDFSVLNDNDKLRTEIRENSGIDVQRVEISKINKAKNELTVWIFFSEKNKTFVSPAIEQPLELPTENGEWESTFSNNY